MSSLKMSELKDKFLNKNVGCFTEEDVLSGNYSQQDVIELLNGYDSLLTAFSKFSNSHDQLEQEKQQLIEVGHTTNKALRQENAELRELATMVVNLSKVSDVPIYITAKAKQLLNK